MPCKRFSPISDTFLVTPFGLVFRQIEFFNSHMVLGEPIEVETQIVVNFVLGGK